MMAQAQLADLLGVDADELGVDPEDLDAYECPRPSDIVRTPAVVEQTLDHAAVHEWVVRVALRSKQGEPDCVNIGARMRWDQMGWQDKPLWCIGGDGAMFDIGFQSLSRLLASGMPVEVFVLDTQVYSNTGGQASTASFTGQNTKMTVHGKAIAGKQERRKEIAQIAMMHPRSYVAQTTCAHVNHFYKSVLGCWSLTARPSWFATRPVSRSTAWPTIWPASRPAWPWIAGRFRC